RLGRHVLFGSRLRNLLLGLVGRPPTTPAAATARTPRRSLFGLPLLGRLLPGGGLPTRLGLGWLTALPPPLAAAAPPPPVACALVGFPPGHIGWGCLRGFSRLSRL